MAEPELSLSPLDSCLDRLPCREGRQPGWVGVLLGERKNIMPRNEQGEILNFQERVL